MMIDPLARNSAMKMQEKLKFSRKCNIGPTNYNLAANFCGGKQVRTLNVTFLHDHSGFPCKVSDITR